MIAVVDYGASNVQSVLRALRAVGAEAVLSADPAVVRGAARVVVPGVGHFAPAMRAGRDRSADAVLEAAGAGKPTLGICLGCSCFSSRSEEAPGVAGLALLRGGVMRFQTSLPVPHVGGRASSSRSGAVRSRCSRAFPSPEAYFYHVHSFHPDPAPNEAALGEAEYGEAFPTILGHENVLGVSSIRRSRRGAGLALLEAFFRWKP